MKILTKLVALSIMLFALLPSVTEAGDVPPKIVLPECSTCIKKGEASLGGGRAGIGCATCGN